MPTRTRKVTHALARGSLSLLLVGAVGVLQGCGASGTGSGVTSSGGATQTGGTVSGGTIAAAGGAVTSGGAVATGGSVVVGGAPGTGGAVAKTGGATGAGGTAPLSGGAAASGGVASMGGVAKAGGAVTSGGAVGSGGASSAGGTTGAGGASKPPVTGGGSGHFQMENLDRGVVAVKVSGGVYVGWRMFGYEYSGTDSETSYNLYKDGAKLANVTDSTNYLDAAGTATSKYSVSAVLKGTEGAQSAAVTPWAQQYISIPLTKPGSQYNANDGATGDLDGDGKLDIVVKWEGSTKDNSQAGVTDPVYLAGYTLAGKQLWMINLGINIRGGAHYTQMSVGDFDGDGKAEVSVKTAPGTKDGTGAYLSTGPAATDDDTADYRNTDGYILTGPEYLTVFAGDTGKELATVNYPVPRGNVGDWGDTYGNRLDRYNGGIAFVSDTGTGKTATGRPSIIQQRGYYTRLTMSAYNWRDGALTKVWTFDSNVAANSKAAGQGDHSAMAADVDGDGAQEIITGPLTIGSDGTWHCSSGMGHGDAFDATELVPGKGISVFSIHEGSGGMDAHDANTCTFYFKTTEPGVDSNRGRAEYVGPGNENTASCYCSSCNEHLAACATGDATIATTTSPGSNFVIYWDADEWRELENGTSITKATGETLLNATGCQSNNGTKSTPTLTADLLGDWREEIVYRDLTNANLRVYTTTDVTKRRIYTLMHDPTYRAQVAFENASYNQPPHPGFRIAPNMDPPPVPSIYVK